jgi:hypothetical protein
MKPIEQLQDQLAKELPMIEPPLMEQKELLQKVEQFFIKYSTSQVRKQPVLPLDLSYIMQDLASHEKIKQTLLTNITTAQLAFTAQTYQQAEEHYMMAINLALEHGQYNFLIDGLTGLAKLNLLYAAKSELNLSIRQQYLIYAAALYNKALIFCKEEEDNYAIIYYQTITVEVEFLKLLGKRSEQYPNLNEQHKSELQNIREEIEKEFTIIIQNDLNKSNWWENEQNVKAIQELYKKISTKMQLFMGNLLRECIAILGEAPCEFAVIAFGSTARSELTPYSDFEWGILISEEKEENKPYFRNLTNFLFLKTIGLGETPLRTMNIKGLTVDDYAIGKKGLSFDSLRSYACKWPLGRTTIYNTRGELVQKGFELICTPEHMLIYQIATGYEKTLHLATTLNCVTAIETCCSKENLALVQAYEQLLQKHQQQVAIPVQPYTQAILTIGQQQALCTLEEDLMKFEYTMASQDQSGKQYNVKKDLYRILNIILDAFGIYYALVAKSGWDKIQEMYLKELVNRSAAKELNKLMSILAALRLSTYLQLHNQQETLSPIDSWSDSDAFGKDHWEILCEMYKVVLPLVEEAKKFLASSGQVTVLKEATLYDPSQYIVGLVHVRFMHYSEALQHFIGFLTNLPQSSNNIANAWNALGNTLCLLGQPLLGKDCYRHVFNYPLPPSIRASRLTNLSNTYGTLDYYSQQNQRLEEALSIQVSHYKNKEHIEIATTLNNLAMTHLDLEDPVLAEKLLEDALTLQTRHYGTREHPAVTRTLANKAHVYRVFGEHAKCRELCEEVFSIRMKLYGFRKHLMVVDAMEKLANVYEQAGELLKQKVTLEEALYSKLQYYKDPCNIPIINTLQALADCYGSLGYRKEQLNLLEKVLDLLLKYYGTEQHIRVSQALEHYLNACNIPQNKLAEAKNILTNVLLVKTDHYLNKNHPDIVLTLNSLAIIEGNLGNLQEKQRLLTEALNMLNTYYQKRENVDIERIMTLFNLAVAAHGLGDLTTEKTLLKQIINMQIKIYGKNDHIDGFMKHQVGKQQRGYYKHEVLRDGDCGFTAFGVTRVAAYNLLSGNVTNVQVSALIKLAIRSALITKDFYDHLKSKGVIKQNINFDMICNNTGPWANDAAIANAYLQYDIIDKRVDFGWVHPGILQALAHINSIKIRMWRQAQDQSLIPHKIDNEDYSCYTPAEYTTTIDLLFINGNHFDRLELIGCDDLATYSPIYPLNSPWSHIDIIRSLFRLVLIYKQENKYKKALPLVEKLCTLLVSSSQYKLKSDLSQEALSLKKQIDQEAYTKDHLTWVGFHLEEMQRASNHPEIALLLADYFHKTNDLNNAIIYGEKVLATYKQALASLPSLNDIYIFLADLYHIKGKEHDLTIARMYFQRAIEFNPTAITRCAYGNFLYHQAQNNVFLRQELLGQAISQFLQVIILADHNAILTYDNLEKPIIETHLQQLLATRKSIEISATFLAYYLLIKANVTLGHIAIAQQKLDALEEHLAYKLSLNTTKSEILDIELLLLENVKQLIVAPQTTIVASTTTIPQHTPAVGSITSEVELGQLVAFTKAKLSSDAYLIEHRQESVALQRAYDQRFGLIIRKSNFKLL